MIPSDNRHTLAQLDPTTGMELAHFLVVVENWEQLIQDAGNGIYEAILARFSGLVYTHFGSDFQSITLGEGEFFVIVSYPDQKKLIEKCNQLKHDLEKVKLGNDMQPCASISLSKSTSTSQPYEVLVKLRKILEYCLLERSSIFLVV